MFSLIARIRRAVAVFFWLERPGVVYVTDKSAKSRAVPEPVEPAALPSPDAKR